MYFCFFLIVSGTQELGWGEIPLSPLMWLCEEGPMCFENWGQAPAIWMWEEPQEKGKFKGLGTWTQHLVGQVG